MNTKKYIAEDGGKHCLTCIHFPHVPFVVHKFYCPKMEQLVEAGVCDEYRINTKIYYSEPLHNEHNIQKNK